MGWQSQAWTFFDSVGELRYLATWIGNVLSLATLHAAKRNGNELVPLTEGPAREAMDALYGGPQQQASMLQLLGVDTTVSGEGYITARGDDWDVLSTGKVNQSTNGVITANFGGTESRVTMTKEDLLIRIWTPHPTDPNMADAPTRSNLKTLAQIVGYDDHISAQLTSRLAGNGILFLPSEINFAAPNESDPEATQANTFLTTLAEAMTAAKQDLNSPASFVPIVVTAPGEDLDKVQHLTFWSDLDQAVIEMRTAAIKRFAIGMDTPPEVLVGNEDANHWNAWLSEESAIKTHIEPRLGVIVAGLTTDYLRPALTGLVPDEELGEYFVIADTSPIRTRPNKSTESFELHDRGLINAEAVRRETGFKTEDAMDPAEHVRWLLQRIAVGAVTPELTAEALRLLGAQIDPAEVIDIGEIQQQPDHTRTDTDINDDGQVGGPPTTQPDPVAASAGPSAFVAACEVLVFRALERAGNRLRNAHPRTDSTAMPVHRVYMSLSGDGDHLLDGAWDCAPTVLDGYIGDVAGAVDVLDFYVRGLLSQHREHSRHTLSALLDAAHLDALATV